jgi:protease IV
MSFKTASAILRGRWMIDKAWATAHMPLVVRMMKGEAVDFGGEEKSTEVEPQLVLSNKKAGGIYKVGYYTDMSKIPNDSIAMVGIYGPITKYGDMCAYGAVDHVLTMNRLANSPNIKGVIIDMDSPGGEVSGTAMLADAIKALDKVKPVIGFIDDGIAASAGKWIISACREVYTSQKTDQVGSVGVYCTVADWYSYFESEGLKVRDVYAPQSTDKNQDYMEAIKGNEDPLKAELKVLADEFIATIKKNRGAKLTSDEWTTGKMFYSKDAIRIGLIDGMKSFDQVAKRMDQLVQQKQATSNSNTMSFEKTLVAAKAEAFEVVEGGFLLEEAHLNNIEATFAERNQMIATQATQIATLGEAKGGLEQQLATATATVAERDQTITANNTRIAELEAEVVTLGGKPAAPVAIEEPAEDKFEEKGTKANDFAFQKEILQSLK